MGLRDRDYMHDERGERQGSRYEDEVREAKYEGFYAKQQSQSRKVVLIFLVVIAIIVIAGVLASKK